MWTTTDNVLNRTGCSVTDAQVAIAQGMIEVEANVTEDESTWLNARQTRWLARATEYQAAFIHDNPEVITMMDHVSQSQPDLSVILKQPGASTSPWIHPLAGTCIRRAVGGNGSRSERLSSELTDGNITEYNDDPIEGWSPIH